MPTMKNKMENNKKKDMKCLKLSKNQKISTILLLKIAKKLLNNPIFLKLINGPHHSVSHLLLILIFLYLKQICLVMKILIIT